MTTNTHHLPDFLTIAETATLWGCSERTVYRRIYDKGTVAYKKTAGQPLIPRSEARRGLHDPDIMVRRYTTRKES